MVTFHDSRTQKSRNQLYEKLKRKCCTAWPSDGELAGLIRIILSDINFFTPQRTDL